MGVCESNANLMEQIEQHTNEKNQTEKIEQTQIEIEKDDLKNSLQDKINILTMATEKINKYKEVNNELKEINAELNEINGELKECIDDKNIQILENENDLKEMEYKILQLENEANARKQSNSINDILYKVHGDTVNKLKINKMSAKFVIFISGINHLFYYDETIQRKKSYSTNTNNNKSEPKCIIIRDITISNGLIDKQLNKPWFLIIGTRRKALFIAESIGTRDKWLNFINKSLRNHGQQQCMPFSPVQTHTQTLSQSQSQTKSITDISDLTRITNFETNNNKQKFESKLLKFNYPSKIENCTIINNGHTVQINIASNAKCILLVNNQIYYLKQFHFHIPSEHTINNKKYEMEMHLVHMNNKTNKMIVLCFIFTTTKQLLTTTNNNRNHNYYHSIDSSNSLARKTLKLKNIYQKEEKKETKKEESDDNETDVDECNDFEDENNENYNDFLQQFWDELPLKKTKQTIPLRNALNFDYLFKTTSDNFAKNSKTNEINVNMQIFEYIGALRTPPYTKGVTWLVCKTTHFINWKQLNKLKKIWYTYL